MRGVRTQTDLEVTSTKQLQPTNSQPVSIHARSPGEATVDLVFFRAPDLSGLEEQARQLIDAICQRKDLPFSEHCALHNDNLLERSDAGQACRLAVLAVSADDLQSKIDYFLSNRQQLTEELFHTKGIYYKQGCPVTPAETALLFPGQASQYPTMFHGICTTYASVRAWLRKADAFWFSRYKQTVSSLLFPSGISEEEALERLRQTHVMPAPL